MVKHNSSPSTLTTYLAALKRALNERLITGNIAITNTTRIQSILRGSARTHIKPTGDDAPSISAPFTVDHYQRLLSLFYALPKTDKGEYNDTLYLAIMGMGLGGCLRPGEYLTTNIVQRGEAILTFSSVFIHGRRAPATRATRIPSLEFVTSYRHHYRQKSINVDYISLTIRCSKTDQTHMGVTVVVDDPHCVKQIMKYILQCPSHQTGETPFFLHFSSLAVTALQAVNGIRGILRRTQFCSPDDFSTPDDFTLKSLRSGAVQTLVDNNAGEGAIAARGRWTNITTPLRHYVRRASSSLSTSSSSSSPSISAPPGPPPPYAIAPSLPSITEGGASRSAFRKRGGPHHPLPILPVNSRPPLPGGPLPAPIAHNN